MVMPTMERIGVISDDDECDDSVVEEKELLDDMKHLKSWGFDGMRCDCCGISNSEVYGLLMQCAKCKKAYYCSTKCFNDHLPIHQKHCGTSGWLERDPAIVVDGVRFTARGIEKGAGVLDDLEVARLDKHPNSPRRRAQSTIITSLPLDGSPFDTDKAGGDKTPRPRRRAQSTSISSIITECLEPIRFEGKGVRPRRRKNTSLSSIIAEGAESADAKPRQPRSSKSKGPESSSESSYDKTPRTNNSKKDRRKSSRGESSPIDKTKKRLSSRHKTNGDCAEQRGDEDEAIQELISEIVDLVKDITEHGTKDNNGPANDSILYYVNEYIESLQAKSNRMDGKGGLSSVAEGVEGEEDELLMLYSTQPSNENDLANQAKAFGLLQENEIGCTILDANQPANIEKCDELMDVSGREDFPQLFKVGSDGVPSFWGGINELEGAAKEADLRGDIRRKSSIRLPQDKKPEMPRRTSCSSCPSSDSLLLLYASKTTDAKAVTKQKKMVRFLDTAKVMYYYVDGIDVSQSSLRDELFALSGREDYPQLFKVCEDGSKSYWGGFDEVEAASTDGTLPNELNRRASIRRFQSSNHDDMPPKRPTRPKKNDSQEDLLVLYAKKPLTELEFENQQKMSSFLIENRIDYAAMDGSDTSNEVVRSELMELSGRADYPQFFLISNNGSAKFLGGWDEPQQVVEDANPSVESSNAQENGQPTPRKEFDFDDSNLVREANSMRLVKNDSGQSRIVLERQPKPDRRDHGPKRPSRTSSSDLADPSVSSDESLRSAPVSESQDGQKTGDKLARIANPVTEFVFDLDTEGDLTAETGRQRFSSSSSKADLQPSYHRSVVRAGSGNVPMVSRVDRPAVDLNDAEQEKKDYNWAKPDWVNAKLAGTNRNRFGESEDSPAHKDSPRLVAGSGELSIEHELIDLRHAERFDREYTWEKPGWVNSGSGGRSFSEGLDAHMARRGELDSSCHSLPDRSRRHRASWTRASTVKELTNSPVLREAEIVKREFKWEKPEWVTAPPLKKSSRNSICYHELKALDSPESEEDRRRGLWSLRQRVDPVPEWARRSPLRKTSKGEALVTYGDICRELSEVKSKMSHPPEWVVNTPLKRKTDSPSMPPSVPFD